MTIEAKLLGAAQDGGVPQAGCDCENCSRAHADPTKRRFVSSLGLLDRGHQSFWLIDATPDFREQLYLLQSHAPDSRMQGIFLTHAHMGHYGGLLHLGREAMNPRQLPVYGTPAMGDFLRANAPWSQLIEIGNIEFQAVAANAPVNLTPNLTVTPIPVPHRGEYSDTVAYLIQGPGKRLFYCPDIDNWQEVSFDIKDFLQEVDLALVDGTFFAAGELPKRDMGEVPHPLVRDSAALFQGVEADLHFIHLNHTNPLWQNGPERKWLEENGFAIGEQGQRWVL